VTSASTLLSATSLGIWLYLTLGRGMFWRLRPFDDDSIQHAAIEHAAPPRWPRVVAIIPARNEAATIGETTSALLRQDYPGEFSFIVVDDHSEDETPRIAQQFASQHDAQSRVQIHLASPLPPGWTGKLWALDQGVRHVGPQAPEFYWFTDADVVHAPHTLRRLVARAEQDRLDLVSLMVLLQAKTLPERALIPAFLFFFLKLYPPRWIANPNARTAGAAGGCVLLRRSALAKIGGLAAIRNEVIDDCSLARAVKRAGGPIWMGVTRASHSLRAYVTFAEIRDVIARTAFATSLLRVAARGNPRRTGPHLHRPRRAPIHTPSHCAHPRARCMAADVADFPADSSLLSAIAALGAATPPRRLVLRICHLALRRALLVQPRRSMERPRPSPASGLTLCLCFSRRNASSFQVSAIVLSHNVEP